MINTSLQKGFRSEINSTLEHISITGRAAFCKEGGFRPLATFLCTTLTAVIEKAKKHNLPLNLTFLDLRNVIWSVSH